MPDGEPRLDGRCPGPKKIFAHAVPTAALLAREIDAMPRAARHGMQIHRRTIGRPARDECLDLEMQRMISLPKWAALALLLLALAADVGAQRAVLSDRSTLERGGRGVNTAPLPGTFTVVSVDSYGQVVRLRADDGSTADVYVGADTYDVSKLNLGDRIQVNFIESDDANSRLKAANIWPVK